MYPFTILEDQVQTTISIPITDDQTVEILREQFSLSLSVRPQPGLSLDISETSITIVDDDGMTCFSCMYTGWYVMGFMFVHKCLYVSV